MTKRARSVSSGFQRAMKLFKERGGVLRTSEVLGAGIHQRILYAMRDTKKKSGLATLCLGGGNAVALSVEML